VARRLPIGAEPGPEGTHFRVWAPACRRVAVVLPGDGGAPAAPPFALHESNGYFEGTIAQARAGSTYRLELDGEGLFADPASRFQPDGPHGPSEIIDPAAFRWTDQGWSGPAGATPVVYEMHVGTFTTEGTFAAAMRHLPALADLGVSIVELLPLAEFAGRFGWGYDGVLPFAPTRLYGRPDDVRRFVDAAHAHGVGVVLDVVYNHFGPDGCYLDRYSPSYFADTATEWGRGLNFDGANSAGMREYVISNARYWIDEFHFDGLRLDATHAIVDRSRPHIVAEIAAAVREAGRNRRTWVVGENEAQHAWLIDADANGTRVLDALWNDDFHHTAMVALTGRREAYYTDYLGTPQEFISAAKYGFLYQGQWYRWQHQPRGTDSRHLPASAFVAFLENHDQVANSIDGRRLHERSLPSHFRALTTLLLLGPWTPMLFQGQEFQSSAPFLYFADHAGDLGRAVRDGRREFLSQFPSIAQDMVAKTIPDPGDEATFARCKLDHGERERHRGALRLHHDLIRLRRSDDAFHTPERFVVDGCVLTDRAFALRFSDTRIDAGRDPFADRLLVVSLGVDRSLEALPDPLLSPFPAVRWRTMWSSESPEYGGSGSPELQQPDGWRLPAGGAVVLAPERA
jgi:maltooligosyltrehalose trehalohydrolase